jgi:acyl-CoA thioesterase I
MYLRFLFLCFALVVGPVSGAAEPRTVLVVGDSLSAAFGIDQAAGWVALLDRRLQKEFSYYTVVNASISGDTTSGALSRIDAALVRHKPRLVILELGGNDGLRGLPVTQIRANLEQLVQRTQRAGAKVLLLGMRIPANYGPAYTRAFENVYAELAKQFAVPLVPFFLDGVALDPALMQDDGIHPKAQAQQKLLDNVWPELQPLLD